MVSMHEGFLHDGLTCLHCDAKIQESEGEKMRAQREETTMKSSHNMDGTRLIVSRFLWEVKTIPHGNFPTSKSKSGRWAHLVAGS